MNTSEFLRKEDCSQDLKTNTQYDYREIKYHQVPHAGPDVTTPLQPRCGRIRMGKTDDG